MGLIWSKTVVPHSYCRTCWKLVRVMAEAASPVVVKVNSQLNRSKRKHPLIPHFNCSFLKAWQNFGFIPEQLHLPDVNWVQTISPDLLWDDIGWAERGVNLSVAARGRGRL